MEVQDALRALAAAGTAQNRKGYARHGVAPPLFGVSFAELGRLGRAAGVDHALALALWDAGNHDARLLATMVADPERSTARLLAAWGKDVANYVLADAVAGLAACAPAASGLDDEALAAHLATIEADIHARPNRTRYAMNSALIAIGCRSPALRRKAVAAARRIGPVEVDHGATGCRTPDAAAYVAKVVAHRRARRRKKA